jgi:hypothetical protein
MAAVAVKVASVAAEEPAVDAKAAKRAEIIAKLAAAKAETEKLEQQKANYFGEHPGISCQCQTG